MQSQSKRISSVDFFAVLGLPRTPWIDADRLKAHYLEIARQSHPDQAEEPESKQAPNQPDSATVNEAYQVLGNDVTRLVHFLALETGHDTAQERDVPKQLVDVFMGLSPLFHEADQTIQLLRVEQTPILRANHYLSATPLLTSLSDASTKLSALAGVARTHLQTVAQAWLDLPVSENGQQRDAILTDLRDTYRTLSFLQRWQNNIAERSFELTPS
ncbi:MAG: Co-chaperone protein HscB [Verrucomicrobia subdivision 3 bacterium]|nr:Co-chaperone protein HscB [Limisphaerales bacterium]MCS1415184.1 Co-chaperone protein HscB [Limisphaerales bacterium]